MTTRWTRTTTPTSNSRPALLPRLLFFSLLCPKSEKEDDRAIRESSTGVFFLSPFSFFLFVALANARRFVCVQIVRVGFEQSWRPALFAHNVWPRVWPNPTLDLHGYAAGRRKTRLQTRAVVLRQVKEANRDSCLAKAGHRPFSLSVRRAKKNRVAAKRRPTRGKKRGSTGSRPVWDKESVRGKTVSNSIASDGRFHFFLWFPCKWSTFFCHVLKVLLFFFFHRRFLPPKRNFFRKRTTGGPTGRTCFFQSVGRQKGVWFSRASCISTKSM